MPPNISTEDFDLEVWTEGKTDWKILKRAIKELNLNLKVKFHEYENNMGGDKLKEKCSTFAERDNPKPIVFIIDHDVKKNIDEMTKPDAMFKDWGSNVFSFAIPIPDHRANYENLSIEFYFSDIELKTTDHNGRRLFLTSEFIEKSGNLTTNPSIHVGNVKILKNHTTNQKAKIIDTDVFDSSNNNIALTKSMFAEYVAQEEPPFDKISFDAFHLITDILETISSISKPKIPIYFPPIDEISSARENQSIEEQLLDTAKAIFNISYLALEIFCITAIRCYEIQMSSKSIEKYVKRSRPIEKILSEKFTNPNLINLTELARACFHLVDNSAPQSLLDMKEDLRKAEALGEIGIFIDDLQKAIPPKFGTPIYAEKHNLKRSFLEYIIPELAQYENVIFSNLHKITSTETLQRWESVYKLITQRLGSLFINPLNLKIIENYDPKKKTYIANIRTYNNNRVTAYQEYIKDSDDIESKITDMLLSDGRSIHLYPFLVIKEDKLYFYKNQKGEKGFVYTTLFEEVEHIDHTTKKFNHVVFKTGSEQELYWTDVLPTVNSVNNIKANIPEDRSKFVGRKEQKRIIREEILEIPNQNGILYGPGGIGKTALMLQLAKELHEETNPNEILFTNIIWISAKTDFYDYVFGIVENRAPQFRSLEQILEAILEFFSLDHLNEYSIEDKKYLTLEILRENKVLLVLDNFETVDESEVDKIVRFFDIEVKKELRKKPDYFKVVITSRKQIPCGFHQLELKGLDDNEADELMDNLFKDKYKNAAKALPKEQKNEITKKTEGIPIVIKHCFARIYEYNEPLNYVLHSLGDTGEIVQFSFSEVLQQIEKKDLDKTRLKILILLELFNYPLMTTQMGKILEISQSEIEKRISLLVDYQCLSRVFEEGYEKYNINNEIKLLTRSLAQKYVELSKNIRNQITNNFSIEDQFDYSKEESQFVQVFNTYISQRNYLEAEKFIQDQIKNKPSSVILNYHYAKHLKERKHDIDQAISILESIRQKSMNNAKILILLVECFANQAIPNFEKGDLYARQIEDLEINEDTKIELARFYIHWSTSLKMKVGGDPFEEQQRQDKYQSLAMHALEILEDTSKRTHAIYQLLAQCHYNLWDYDPAIKMIDKAIESAEKQGDFSQVSYKKFRNIMIEKKRKFRNQ